MSVLEKICANKRDHVDLKMRQAPLNDLKVLVEEQSVPRGFINRLKEKSEQGTALITEVKKASPSKGLIREDFDAVEIATTYQENGASCLSVLTDEPYFQGHDDYFKAVRQAVDLPMLRKDFMIDPYQIYESRALGADCILLIMACLDDNLAHDLYDLTTDLGMDALFEVHDAEELTRALALNPKMIGVNNRNLKTLNVDLQTGLDLAHQIPDTVVKVAESGISRKQEIDSFKQTGYNAFLIGESLMRQDNIGSALKKLL
jgi:indole-3-glycerol phosphate synthase